MAEEVFGGESVEGAPPQKPEGDGRLIEQRLRLHAAGYVAHYPWEWAEDAAPLLAEAAGEIERLRSMLRLQDAVIRSGDTACLTEAERAAIETAALALIDMHVGVIEVSATLRGLLERTK